jgi:low affinity Fe/Cu permease
MHAPPDLQQTLAVVTFLAPFLPYLIAGATEAAKGLGKKVGELGGEVAWKKAQALWVKLKERLSPKQKAKANVIALDPADKEEVASFVKTLAETLKADPELSAELVAALGEDESVQKVIALNKSWVQDIVQRGSGIKTVHADQSTVINVRQES